MNDREELRKDLVKIAQEHKVFERFNFQEKTFEDDAVDYFLAWHTAKLNEARVETAKAFGGCTNCYGKGYATAMKWAAAKGKKWPTSGPMQYCKCDRGKQLRGQVASKVEEARIDTLERLRLVCASCQRMTNFMEDDLRNFKNGLCGNCGADALKADFQSIRSEIQALQSKEGDR